MQGMWSVSSCAVSSCCPGFVRAKWLAIVRSQAEVPGLVLVAKGFGNLAARGSTMRQIPWVRKMWRCAKIECDMLDNSLGRLKTHFSCEIIVAQQISREQTTKIHQNSKPIPFYDFFKALCCCCGHFRRSNPWLTRLAQCRCWYCSRLVCSSTASSGTRGVSLEVCIDGDVAPRNQLGFLGCSGNGT